MSYRLRNMLIAVALAGIAALLVTYYVSNYKKSVQKENTTVPVLVAAKDIPLDTLGTDVASKGYLSTQQIARKAVVPGAISSPDQIKSLVATQTVFAGQQVTLRSFGPLVQKGIKGDLTATYRAVQLEGDANQVLAGTIQPGDHVDFEAVVTVHTNGGNDTTFSRIAVRNVKVLQTQIATSSGKIGGGGSDSAVILRLTDAQTQKVGLVYACAREGSSCYWTLALRPALRSQDSPNSVETAWTLLSNGISTTALKAAFAIGTAGG